MTVAKYRKKPVTVDAMQWTGPFDNYLLQEFCGHWVSIVDGRRPLVTSLEGAMTVSPGDWVIKGVKGEFYPCKDDIFKLTYEQVQE